MTIRVLGFLLLAAALAVAGCDEHAVETGGTSNVVFDLRPLFQSAAGEACASVVAALELTVTEADGTTQTVERALAPDEAEVRIPVEVEAGTVTFDAEVRSNNGTRLYAGSASVDVAGDGFQVAVPLSAVAAVLKACPDLVPLDLDDGRYVGELRVINRGIGDVVWNAAFDTPLCDNTPCFSLNPSASTVAAGDTVQAVGLLQSISPATTFPVQIVSEVGTLDVQFVADFVQPVARPDTVTVLEDGTVTIDVLANDVDPEGDPLTLVSVGDALFGTADLGGNLVQYAANYEPVWGTTSEDRFDYIVDAGGRRNEGAVTVRVDPCIAFEERASVNTADLPFLTENGVALVTRAFALGDGETLYESVVTRTVFDASDDLGAYLTDAAVEFDWTSWPVRYVRFDFVGDVALANIALNGAAPVVAADLVAAASGLPDVSVQVEDGKFGDGSRLVLEASETPIDRLLVGGGDPNNESRTLLIDDVCFGLAAPDE